MQSQPILLLAGALCALPALAQTPSPRFGAEPAAARSFAHSPDGQERAVDLRAGRPPLQPGLDDALPAPRGEAFFQAHDAAPFTGRTDAELAGAPAVDLVAHDPHARLHFTEQSSGTWIRGRTYKARVHAGGFEYIPFLGSSAPRSWPVALRLVSATLDGQDLDLTPSASVTREGDRIVLDRGPVEVLYDFALDSVEQSFAVDAAGAAGDLVLNLSVASDLAPSEDGARFRFDGPRGGIRYGAAVAFDGAGRSADVPATLVGDRLELTVPAAFLAAAEGMILVDPVLSTFTVDSVGGDQRDIDVAYDQSNDAYTFVYEDTFSGTDTDIYCTIFTSAAAFVNGFYIDSSSETWTDPSIANLNSANKHLIAASRINPSTGDSEIVGRILDATAHTLTPEVLIGDATASWENFRPDVGGNSSGQAFSLFLVVWERHFANGKQPRYRTVLPDGTLGPLQTFDNGLFERTGVVISKSTGDPTAVNLWNIAYRSVETATGLVSLRGVQLNAGGAIVAGPANIKTLPAGQDLGEVDVSEALDLDGFAPTYAVSYDQYPTPIEDTQIVFCRNNVRVGEASLQISEHADLGRQQAEARLSTTATDFMVTYFERQPSGIIDVFISTFDLAEGSFLALSERRTRLGSTDDPNWRPGEGAALASRFSGGLYTSRIAGATWARHSGSSLDAVAATHIASGGFSQAFQYCYGNPNSTGDRGFIALYGDRSTTGAKELVATALPTNTFGYFICGRDFANVANPSGSQGVLCVGGVIGRYSNAVANSGAQGRLSLTLDPTMLSQPSGPVPALVGQIWQFQCWHRDSVGGQSTSNFTNAVTMLFR